MAADGTFIAALQSAFAAQANPAQAAPMQAYMKSTLPFLGIAAPQRRRLTAEVAKAQPLQSESALADTMRALWRTARFRELRYAASELAGLRPHAALRSQALLPVFEEMIVSGAWWDHCDEISGNGISALLQRWPEQIKPVLRRWANGENMWLRRASFLCQRRLKDGFDAVLFYETILPSIGGPSMAGEFFIRKGLGWALRERAYAAPDEVRAFCAEYRDRLSTLTLREALRVIDKH